jgi:hypothetical protein
MGGAMGGTWRPITRDEFDDLVAEQVAALDPGRRATLDRSRVEPRQAIIRRTEGAGDERVWVIAERQGQVLYFDDVEWGWNWSEVDREDRILRPGGGQGELMGMLGSQGTAS